VSYGYNPPPVTEPLRVWAQNVVTYLQRTASRLAFRRDDARTAEDGVILWDEANGYPVVSKGGVYRQVVLADGYAMLAITDDVTAAAINTAYPLVWDSPASAIDGVTLSGSQLTFAEGGFYAIAFAAQIQSSSASTVNFWFWPRVNTVDVPGSTIKASLHNNGGTNVVSRTAIFYFDAGDVLQAMWAVDRLAGILSEEAATAFAPETPAVTLSITRVRA